MALSDPCAHTEGCSSFQSTLSCVRAPSISQTALRDSQGWGEIGCRAECLCSCDCWYVGDGRN